MVKFIVVYITCRNDKESEKISKNLLNKRLVACVNIFPVKSRYWWKGKIQSKTESSILAKTKKVHFNKIKLEIKKIHSYQVPAIECWDFCANKDYLKWIEQETA